MIALVGYIIVFSALLILYFFFNFLPRIIYFKRGKKEPEGNANSVKQQILGEETAAIAMALHLFLDEFHDEESGVLTIKKTSKAYSPWSSKIYAVRNQFNRI
jgi:Na+-transporting methylmalonyl-CoA/oxaloacetate decarboxylase gamma subunit